MKKDIHFIFDEEWEEQQKELRQVLHETQDPELHKNVFILENFVRAAASVFSHKVPSSALLGKEIMKPKYYQRVLNIPSGVDVQPIPVPSTDVFTQPAQEFKEVPLFEQKVIVESPPSVKLPVQKNLIIDKITQRVLARALVSDRYTLEEPSLDQKDLQVLHRVVRKNFKNMEKGWKFIQKYGKKYSIQPDHDTFIKYYVVNDVFGLGKIEPLLHDSDITSWICDGSDKPVFVELQGKNIPSTVIFTEEDLRNFITGIAHKFNKTITRKTPNVRGVLRGFTFFVGFGDDFKSPHFVIKRGDVQS